MARLRLAAVFAGGLLPKCCCHVPDAVCQHWAGKQGLVMWAEIDWPITSSPTACQHVRWHESLPQRRKRIDDMLLHAVVNIIKTAVQGCVGPS